jgi:hypothetical protein
MALSQSDLDRLDVAIASSELRVEVDGRSVTYRSVEELKAARAHVAGVIAQQASPGRPRASYYYTPILGRER